jgi:hypothetical protein
VILARGWQNQSLVETNSLLMIGGESVPAARLKEERYSRKRLRSSATHFNHSSQNLVTGKEAEESMSN